MSWQAKNEVDAAVLVDEYELTHKAHTRSYNVYKDVFSTNININVKPPQAYSRSLEC